MAHRNPNRPISPVPPVRVLAILVALAACIAAPAQAQTAGFLIKEDGVFQSIQDVRCGLVETPSVDIVFLFDVSGSMGDEIEAMKQQATQFALDISDAGLDPRFGLITYGASGEFLPRLRVQMTSNVATFQAAVDPLTAGGGTEPAYDALQFGLDQLALRVPGARELQLGKTLDVILGRQAPAAASVAPEDLNSDGKVDVADVLAARSLGEEARLFFILITDEPSNADQRSEDEVVQALNSAGVNVFAVSPDFGAGSAVAGDVRRVAERTGGIWIDIDGANFTEILDSIVALLTSIYTVEYKASNQEVEPTLRSVELTIFDAEIEKGVCIARFEYIVPGSESQIEPIAPADDNCPEVSILGIDPSDFPLIKIELIVLSLAGVNCELVALPTPTPTPTPTPVPPVPFFVAVDFEGLLLHIDSRTAETRLIRDDLPRSIQSLATAPDGAMWATRTDPVTLTSELLQIDPVTGAFTTPVATTLRDARSLAIATDGTVYTVAGGTTVFPMILSTLNLSNGTHVEIGELFGDETTVQGLAFAPDGRLFGIRPATPVDGNYSLVVIDTATAEVIRMGRFVNAELGQSIAFSPDGRLFAIGGQIAELDPFDGAIIGFPTSIPGDFRGVEFLGAQSDFRAGD